MEMRMDPMGAVRRIEMIETLKMILPKFITLSP